MKVSKIYIVTPKGEQISLSKFHIDGVESIDSIGLSEKGSIIQMLKSDLVITCGDWYNDQHCTDAVAIARIMKMEVIHETRFAQYVKQNNN
jgi:hypothetical protein